MADDKLKLYEERAEGRVWGSYEDESGSVVSFGARASIPNVTRASNRGVTHPVLPSSTAHVEVDEESFACTQEPRDGTPRFEDLGKVLTEEEARALDRAGNAIWDALLRTRPKREWPYEQTHLTLALGFVCETRFDHGASKVDSPGEPTVPTEDTMSR